MSAAAAAKTGEANQGIRRLLATEPIPGALSPYVELIRQINAAGPIERYPGSPWLMAAMSRPGDRVVACELHPEDAVALRQSLLPRRGVQIVVGDGYRALSGLVPPPEKRGLVLLDPPFEQTDEFETLAAAFIAAHRKWPTGVYMLWYPVKDRAATARFHAELANAQIPKTIALTFDIGRTEPGLGAMGLVLCNAPFTFESDWVDALKFLAGALAQGPAASAAIDRIGGE